MQAAAAAIRFVISRINYRQAWGGGVGEASVYNGEGASEKYVAGPRAPVLGTVIFELYSGLRRK